MRRMLITSLGLSLGIWVALAHAGEVVLPPAAQGTAPAAKAAPKSSNGRPIATLGRPLPLAQPQLLPFNDQQVQPASYTPPALGVVRTMAQVKSSDAPKPLPPGDLEENDASAAPKKQPSTKSVTQKPGPHPLTPVTPEPTDASGPGSGPAPGLNAINDCDSGDGCCGTCAGTDCCWTPLWWIRPSTWQVWWRFKDVTDQPYCFWASGEYLLWWIKDSQVPPLVTTSPLGTPRQFAGVLGAPGTQSLFGGSSVDNDIRSGARLNIGFWFDDCQTVGLEGSFLFLGERSTNFTNGTPGFPILARPIFDVQAGTEASELVSFPGVLAGSIAVSSSSKLWGADLNLRTAWWRGCWWHIDGLLGFRYLGVDEDLTIGENLAVSTGGRITVLDQFGTRNNFYGGQLGMEIGTKWCRWSLDFLGKVALGSMHQVVNINGNSTFTTPGLPTMVQPGGLLALPTNSGHTSADRFAVVPEAGVKFGYQLTQHVKLFAGYTFLYVSDLARPGHQIDRGINVTQLPSQVGPGTLVGPARPAPVTKGTDFWAQGVNFGLEIRY